jgi:predicted nuclease of predicted toxin-antitoxin system
MRFLVDAQLPPVLARWIAAKGHAAQHVAELGMAGASDQAIWDKAIELKSVLVSKDEDFTQLSIAGGGPQIVWITSGNTSKRELLAMMKKTFPQIAEALEAGERIVEVR